MRHGFWYAYNTHWRCLIMKTKCDYSLKPETIGLLKSGGLLMTLLYAASVLLYYAAGSSLDFQLALVWSEYLATGLRAGFGLQCL